MDDQKAKALLLDRKQELIALLEATMSDSDPVELDQTRVGRLSRMDALQVQAMAQETERRRHNELSRIEAALTRLQDGDYGYCVSCDEEIPDKRLELDPSTAICVGCAAK